ncbi:MAG TPA: hypothetical protein VGJ28_12035 [Micromonosporaceae bacterium]
MTVRRATAIVIAVSLGAVSLAGCTSSATTSGGSTPTGSTTTAAAGGPATAGPVDVCTLMPAAQASSIVGVQYTAATSSSNTCTYPTTAAPIPLSINITASSDAAWQSELSTIQEGGGAAPTTFSGVGDHAAGGGNEFGVESGKWIIDILGGDPIADTTTFPKSIALANALISQLH